MMKQTHLWSSHDQGSAQCGEPHLFVQPVADGPTHPAPEGPVASTPTRWSSPKERIQASICL